jgi:hypothetical protein
VEYGFDSKRGLPAKSLLIREGFGYGDGDQKCRLMFPKGDIKIIKVFERRRAGAKIGTYTMLVQLDLKGMLRTQIQIMRM